MGVEEKQAEQYKIAYGLSDKHLEGKIKAVLDPVFRLVADEIRKAIYFYQADEKGATPSSVIIAGGSAAMPEIVSAIIKFINLEVIVGNPFNKIIVDPEAQKTLALYSHLYSVAVGLAMRG